MFGTASFLNSALWNELLNCHFLDAVLAEKKIQTIWWEKTNNVLNTVSRTQFLQDLWRGIIPARVNSQINQRLYEPTREFDKSVLLIANEPAELKREAGEAAALKSLANVLCRWKTLEWSREIIARNSEPWEALHRSLHSMLWLAHGFLVDISRQRRCRQPNFEPQNRKIISNLLFHDYAKIISPK